MTKKNSNVPIDEEVRFQDALTRVEREVELFKNWLANDGRPAPRAGKSPGSGAPGANSVMNWPGGAVSVRNSLDERPTALLHRNISQLKWGGLIAVVVILFAAVAVVVSGYRNTQAILQQMALHDLQITEPTDGASISDGQTIRGSTPYAGLNHYVVLTEAKTGHVSIQPAHATSGGSFAGEMTINGEGADAAQQPEEILLRVLATREQLMAGPLVTYPDDAKLSSHVRLLVKPVDRIVINSPAEGATVGLFEQVTGTSSVANLQHYVLVRRLSSGTAYIQDQTVTGDKGDLTGRAQFGGPKFGIGEQFTVEIIATSTTLTPGVLISKPADAVISKPVMVSRR